MMSEARTAPALVDRSPYVPVSPPPPRPYRDLCSTCCHSEACGSRSTPERPILFCELFEVRARPTAPAAGLLERASGRQSAAERKGLCANCENVRTCALARPEGGVWHCEEYR